MLLYTMRCPQRWPLLALSQSQALLTTGNLLTICILLSFFIFSSSFPYLLLPTHLNTLNFIPVFSIIQSFFILQRYHLTLFPCLQGKSWLQFEIRYFLCESDKNDSHFSEVFKVSNELMWLKRELISEEHYAMMGIPM